MDLDLIRKAAIFAELTDDEAEKIAEICQTQEFKFGQNVFKEGDKGNRLYIISEGEVRISRQMPGSGEEALTVLKAGACFGEMAVFDRSERSTDAIANVDCTLLTITRSDFEMLLDFDRDLAYKVLWSVTRLLSERLRITNDNLKSFLAMSMF
jgi:CRP/FNR family cyclic AMP-dependent transcriptional regulator